jgi:acetylxylan esterase
MSHNTSTINMHFFRLISSFLSMMAIPLTHALTSNLEQVTSFISGPTTAGMYVYIPTTKLVLAPIIVAIHWCGGSANDYYSATAYATYADVYGYIIIYPDSPSSDKCWDVSSLATLTHNGGGDSLTIINMVKYAVANYGGDISRVYASGLSSRAMMTQVLAGAYPGVFSACMAYSGVPDGCFYVPGAQSGAAQAAWNMTCSTGFVQQSAQAWGNLVRSYYPGYDGARPRIALYHGMSDTTLAYQNFIEELKEWSNVLGVSWASDTTNTPVSGYTKMIYGDGTKLLGYSALDIGHSVPVRSEDDLVWFGLMPGPFYPGASSTTISARTTSTIASVRTSTSSVKATSMTSARTSFSSATRASSTTTAAGVSQARWGQCGGTGWTGPTTCASPYICKYSNDWYSQVRKLDKRLGRRERYADCVLQCL